MPLSDLSGSGRLLRISALPFFLVLITAVTFFCFNLLFIETGEVESLWSSGRDRQDRGDEYLLGVGKADITG